MKYIILTFLTIVTVVGQSQIYNFKYFNDEEVQSNFIYDIKQDDKDLIYIASSNGLIIFDGIRFNKLTIKDKLLDNFIDKLFFDGNNKVWFAYYNGGFGYIQDEKIVNLDSNKIVLDFSSRLNNEIRISTERKILTYINDTLKDVKKIPTTQIHYFNKEQYIYLDNEQNLYYSDNNNSNLKIFQAVNFLAINKEQNIISLMSNSNLHIIKLDTVGYLTELNKISLEQFKLEVTNIDFFSNFVEISTKNNGFIEYEFDNNFKTYSTKHFRTNNGLISNNIRCTLFDNEGNLWIGSIDHGILMLPNKKISTYKSKYEHQNENINIIEEFDNNIYFGTDNGLKILYKDRFIKEQYIPYAQITELKKHKDKLWIGTKNNGLFYLQNGNITPFFFNVPIQPKTINCIQFEKQSILVATNTGLYIYKYNTNTTQNITTYDGLAHNVIEKFIIDSKRTFWFDSPNSPLYSYKDGKFEYHTKNGFTLFDITDIIEIEEKEIWITTSSDGLFVYKGNTFKQYTTEDGLLSNNIFFITKTDSNKIIIGHKNGLSIKTENDTNYNFFNIGQINELEYILNRSSFIANNKKLWIGTANGAILLPIKYLSDKKHIPNLEIFKIVINKKEANLNKEIDLIYGNYFIDFNFKAVLLNKTKSISYQYKLEGFDKNWTTLSYNKTFARYQSLKDGNYNFIVKLFINNTYTGISKNVNVKIHKPYWKQYWFYILVASSIIIIFLIAVYIFNKRSIKLRKILEGKVKERTTEIVIINKDLEKLSEKYLKERNFAELQTQELLESISYAKRIQDVILENSEYDVWAKVFKDNFLIYKPKESVSGDFYWGYKNDDEIYLSIGDCTGHGVPGALISILGISLLSEIIETKHNTNHILDELRTRIINKLGQISPDNTIINRDGMDIAILRLNIKTKIAQCSSANNPVYIVRKRNEKTINNLKVLAENKDLILYSTTPDKQPISAFEKMKDFTVTEFQLQENDNVFLFSDGYIDQFGGKNDKKFLRKNFHNVLLSVYGLPAAEQEKIIWNIMKEWMQGYEQIDDISIIGITI